LAGVLVLLPDVTCTKFQLHKFYAFHTTLINDPDTTKILNFHYANELVEFVKSQYNHHFHIEIAAYPEMHPESKNRLTDLQHFTSLYFVSKMLQVS
jgi:hypothetical protein